MIKGFATAEGTARERDRFPELRAKEHFRRAEWVPEAGELWLSSIGLGTYLGEPDEATDRSYTEAIVAAVDGGINVLDTAINYRHQLSERNLGAALRQSLKTGQTQRDELVVCTKAGYLSLDAAVKAEPRDYFLEEYVRPGIVKPEEVAGGMHCMAPRYLNDQMERSRRNLGLETIDVFYLHNPEAQLEYVPGQEFQQRLWAAFTVLEDAVDSGRIRYYGTATWNGYRASAEEREHLELEAVLEVARDAGGEGHHFRFVQVPFNLAMPEAFAYANQKVEGETVSLLEAARRLGVAVVASASLLQGQLTRDLPPAISQTLGLGSGTENAIQFVRSAPGVATALVGMSRAQHVNENLAVAKQPLTPREKWESLWGEIED